MAGREVSRMSCYMVGRDHALALARAAVRFPSSQPLRLHIEDRQVHFCPEFSEDTMLMLPELTGRTVVLPGSRLADLFLLENARSVAFRYEERATEHFDTEPDRITESEWLECMAGKEDDPVHLIKSIHCYEYQACEHPGWKDSLPYKVCKALESRLVRMLPEYDIANWGEPEKKRS